MLGASARLVQKVSGALISGDFRRDEFVWDPTAEGEARDARYRCRPIA